MSQHKLNLMEQAQEISEQMKVLMKRMDYDSIRQYKRLAEQLESILDAVAFGR